MSDRDEARVGLLAHRVEQIAKALDIGVVERGVHLIEHADRRRIGQEHREDERHRGQRLFAAGQQRHGHGLLAGRARKNVEPRLQGIIAFDELQFRRAAVEQQREQLLEMGVHLVEGGEQPFAPFLVQACDGGA